MERKFGDTGWDMEVRAGAEYFPRGASDSRMCLPVRGEDETAR